MRFRFMKSFGLMLGAALALMGFREAPAIPTQPAGYVMPGKLRARHPRQPAGTNRHRRQYLPGKSRPSCPFVHSRRRRGIDSVTAVPIDLRPQQKAMHFSSRG